MHCPCGMPAAASENCEALCRLCDGNLQCWDVPAGEGVDADFVMYVRLDSGGDCADSSAAAFTVPCQRDSQNWCALIL